MWCKKCTDFISEGCRTTAQSTKEVEDLVQGIYTADGSRLTWLASALNVERVALQTDEEFREAIMANGWGKKPPAQAVAHGSNDSPWSDTGASGSRVTKEQFGHLSEWDWVMLETHTNHGPLRIELVDFGVLPRIVDDLMLTYAKPAVVEEGEDPLLLYLPQPLLRARIIENVDGDRVLFLTVGRAVIESQPAVKARDQVLLVTPGEVGSWAWTDEQGVCFGYFKDVCGEVLEWRYVRGATGAPTLLVVFDPAPAAFSEEVKTRALDLGAEQYAACLLGEVSAGSGSGGGGVTCGIGGTGGAGVVEIDWTR